jgi:hypothetical protein
MAACRGAALGAVTLLTLNLLDVIVFGTNAAQSWFADLSPLPRPAALGMLAMSATALVMFVMNPALPSSVRFVTMLLVLGWCGACGHELWLIQRDIPQPQQVSAMARPLTAVMIFGVALIGLVAAPSPGVRGRSSALAILVTAIVAMMSFITAAVLSGGVSDPVTDDKFVLVAVVGEPFEAGVPLSPEFVDRLQTAASIASDGLTTPQIMVFGTRAADEKDDAHTAGATDDFLAAIKESLPDLDTSEGKVRLASSNLESTEPTELIHSLAVLVEPDSGARVIVVAHWYQLARIRLAASRAGLNAAFVAADQTHAVFNQNVLVLREVWNLTTAMGSAAVQFGRDAIAGDRNAAP